MKKKARVPSLKEIEEKFDEYVSLGPEAIELIKKRNERMREEYAAKDAKFTARANAHDLEKFKWMAMKNRIPYQTLLGHVLHKYVSGELVDVEEIKKVLPSLKIKKAK